VLGEHPQTRCVSDGWDGRDQAGQRERGDGALVGDLSQHLTDVD
jgi:hypothetical protein